MAENSTAEVSSEYSVWFSCVFFCFVTQKEKKKYICNHLNLLHWKVDTKCSSWDFASKQQQCSFAPMELFFFSIQLIKTPVIMIHVIALQMQHHLIMSSIAMFTNLRLTENKRQLRQNKNHNIKFSRSATLHAMLSSFVNTSNLGLCVLFLCLYLKINIHPLTVIICLMDWLRICSMLMLIEL